MKFECQEPPTQVSRRQSYGAFAPHEQRRDQIGCNSQNINYMGEGRTGEEVSSIPSQSKTAGEAKPHPPCSGMFLVLELDS